MVAGDVAITQGNVEISGITGSSPVCKKISFRFAEGDGDYNGEFFDVTNNNPNSMYVGVTCAELIKSNYVVKLYDASNNVIAQQNIAEQ